MIVRSLPHGRLLQVACFRRTSVLQPRNPLYLRALVTLIHPHFKVQSQSHCGSQKEKRVTLRSLRIFVTVLEPYIIIRNLAVL
jgi:hypothetical protein